MANTIEQKLKELWAATPALAVHVPPHKVFVGYPLLRSLSGNTTENKYPIVTIKEQSVSNVFRTNENETITSQIRVSVFHVERDRAHQIAAAMYDAWNHLTSTYDRGALLDIKPQSRSESQEPDGAWFVTWTLKALYTVS